MVHGRKRLAFSLAFLLAACATSAPQPANSLTVEALRTLPTQTYALAPADASIQFSARPVAFPAVNGTFSKFDGAVDIVMASEDEVNVQATVDLSSVEIGNQWSENLVKSEGWFNVEEHPKAIFSGALKGWSGTGLGTVEGQLTIRGVTKPATFSILLDCEDLRQCPKDQVGFMGEIELSRSEFGMTEMRALVRDKVQLTFAGSLVAK
ncbi:YceI family protein [Parvularcula sp. ZS-1/3]|uniref:YceI family protein n=1 Tax=Parvularcula mediterranea TaxID=2732508 RepID=A0A7Y3RND6_9PROT|nr:YceI family protein [Parvularcula mediterranea]NNU17238.1 YceI family protein [Parvularcula mediterranea]